jgi:hypothetical protein
MRQDLLKCQDLPIDKTSRPSNLESSWVTFAGPQILEAPSGFTSRTNVQYHLTLNRIERFILQQQRQKTHSLVQIHSQSTKKKNASTQDR